MERGEGEEEEKPEEAAAPPQCARARAGVTGAEQVRARAPARRHPPHEVGGGEEKKSPAPRAWGEVGALGECLVSGAARRLVKVADSGEERMWTTPAESESRLSPRA